MKGRAIVALVVLCAICFIGTEAARKFAPGDEIPLLINTVGPYNNPSETYEYYRFPFCAPSSLQAVRIRQSIGSLMEGDRLYTSLFEHHFAGEYICISRSHMILTPAI